MPSPAKAGRRACNKLAHNSKEWVRISRAKNGDCTWCPPNGGENCTGHHSSWGKKKASKHAYATGKGRKQWYTQFEKRARHKNDKLWYRPEWYDKGEARKSE